MNFSEEIAIKAIQRATSVADKAPEKYQQATYQTVLAILIGNTQACIKVQDNSEPIEQHSEETPEIQDILEVRYDWSDTVIPKLKGISQNLAFLKIALDEFKIDGLSAKQIQQLLFQKFRISKTPNAVSMTLMDAQGKYVDRFKENGEYKYRITRNGIDFLKEEEAKI